MEQLPYADLDDLVPGTALILAPHADDESLGCGGLIAASCARGRPPVVVVVTDGAASHPGSKRFPPDRIIALRQAETIAATSILGLPRERVHFLGLPDTRAPSQGAAFEAAVRHVESMARENAVTTLCTTWRHDPHCDHEATQLLGAAVADRTGLPLLSYPVWGWLLPADTRLPEVAVAGARLDIADYRALKQRAIAAHASQYSDLIDDDPDGFRLPAELLAIFDRNFEVFLRTS